MLYEVITRALPEALQPHDHGAVMILQCPGDDFRSTGAATVDEHDQRVERLGPLLLGGKFKLGLRIAPFGINNHPVVDKQIAHRHGLIK